MVETLVIATSRSPAVSVPFSTNCAEALLDARARAIERGRHDVDKPHIEPGLREHLRDAVAHRARADDADSLIVNAIGDLHPFDGERDAVAAAEAERRDAALQVAPLQRVEQRRQHARAARADRVAERDGAAVDVDLRRDRCRAR